MTRNPSKHLLEPESRGVSTYCDEPQGNLKTVAIDGADTLGGVAIKADYSVVGFRAARQMEIDLSTCLAHMYLIPNLSNCPISA